MTKGKRNWSDEAGSVDFVQVVIGLLIVGIACVGTFASLQFGNDQLNYQMHYRKAMSIARSQVEYWQGRIHTDTPSVREMQGDLNAPSLNNISVTIDAGDPNNPNDDIIGYVRYGQIVPITNLALGKDKTGMPLVSHFIVRANVSWQELGPGAPLNIVKFQGAMVPAAL